MADLRFHPGVSHCALIPGSLTVRRRTPFPAAHGLGLTVGAPEQVRHDSHDLSYDSAMHATPIIGAFFSAVDDGGYKTLLTVHILCAIAWVGGGIMITLQAERARVARNETELVNVVKQADFFATRMFIPLALVLLGMGFGMIAVGHIGFNHPFVMIALTGWALSFLIGAGFLGPQSGKVKKLVAAAANGAVVDVPAEAMARINRIVLVARLDLLILALVVVNMVVKPGGGIK